MHVRKKKRRRRTGMSMIVITILVLFAVVTYKKIDLDKERSLLKAEKARCEKQLAELNEEKDNLDSYKEYVYSDDNIEKIARERLGLVYPDEIVFEAEDD